MSGTVITLLALLGAVVIGLPFAGVWTLTRDTGVPKSPGYWVRRVIGFAIVAAGVSIMFLNVSRTFRYFDTLGEPQRIHLACGTGWHAMFSKENNPDWVCGSAAVLHLWIAGAVAALGLGTAFWGAGRGPILAMVGLVFLLTGLINIAGLLAAQDMGTG